MNTKCINLVDDHNNYKEIIVEYYLAENGSIDLLPIVQLAKRVILITVNHVQLNTLFNLTKVTPYELWYFDEKLEFTGKAFSHYYGEGQFLIQTQAHYVLLFEGNDINYNQLELKNFKCQKLDLEL